MIGGRRAKTLVEHSERFLASLTDEGRYRLLIEAVTDYAIYMLDPTGIVTSWICETNSPSLSTTPSM